MQSEQLQDLFGIGREGIVLGEGFLRPADFHQLHLVELMQPDQAAGAQTGGAGLAPKTRRVGGIFLREITEREEFLAMQVRDRHLGRGRQIKIIAFQPVALLFKLRQLGGANQTRRLDEHRRRHLGVAVIAGVQIQQEIDEGAFEPRAGPGETDEGTATDLGCPLKVEQPMLRAQLKMASSARKRRSVSCPIRAPRDYRLRSCQPGRHRAADSESRAAFPAARDRPAPRLDAGR